MLRIPGVYVDFKGDLTELKRDYRKAAALAKEAGTEISNGMKNAVLPNTVTRSFNQLYRDLTKINRAAAVTANDMKDLGVTLDKDLLRNLNMTDTEFKNLQRRMLNTKAEQQAERAIKSLGKSCNLTTLEMAGLYRKVGANDAALRLLKARVSSNLATMRNYAVGIGVATGATAALAYTIDRVNNMLWDSGLAYARTVKALEEIFGGSKEAAEQIEYLRMVSDRYGQNLYDLLPAYKNFVAATTQSGMSLEDTRTIYEGAVKAIATMGLTAADSGRVLYAFQQMVSKGMRGIAEEVNQQLGEVLPGAFGMFAKSIGVSEAKLRDMMEQGDMTLNHLVQYGAYLGGKFSGEVSDAVRASNQFNQAWEDLKIDMADSGFMESAAGALNDISETFKDPEVRAGMRAMAENLGKLLEVMAKLSKYAGLRGISATAGEAANLSKEGKLGMPLDDFFRKGFFERQKIVDAAKARDRRDYRNDFDWKKARDGFTGADNKTKNPKPKPGVGDKDKNSRFAMPMVQTPDYWGETYDIDYGNDPVAAAIQKRELALNNERIALEKNIELQNRMAAAVDDTYDLDYGSPSDGLSVEQEDYEKRLALQEEFSTAYHEMNMTRFDLEREQVEKQARLYEAAGVKQVELAAWVADRTKAISKAESEQRISDIHSTVSTMTDGFQMISEMGGKHSEEAFKAYKAFKITETLISTYSGAMKAYEAMAAIPVVGPALGIAAAAAVTGFGLAQVGMIAGAEPPSYDVGGISSARGIYQTGDIQEAHVPIPSGKIPVEITGGKNSSSGTQVVQVILKNPVFQDLKTQRMAMAQIAEVVAARVAPGAVIKNYQDDGAIRAMVKKGA